MVAAVIVGIVVGLVSIVPFRIATKKIRTVNPTHSLDMLAPFLLTIAASFVVLVAGLIVCKMAASDVLVPFAAAELVAFVVGVIVFGLVSSKRR